MLGAPAGIQAMSRGQGDGESALWSGIVREWQVTVLRPQFLHLSSKEGGCVHCSLDCLMIRISRGACSAAGLPGPS